MSPLRRAHSAVSVQRASANRKLAPQRRVLVGNRVRNEPIGPYVASTYVSIVATCPRSCPYKDAGCYAQAGMTVRALDRAASRRGHSADDVVAAEVAAIDGLFVRGVPADGARGGRDLRLHVSGDAPHARGARQLAAAAQRYQDRGGGSVWTYTHRWRRIPRSAWGPIAVLASVETTADAHAAVAAGYAPALTVENHAADFAWTHGSLRIVPCPAQTRGTTCAQCRLCLDPELVRRKAGVSFALHGAARDVAVRRLVQLHASKR